MIIALLSTLMLLVGCWHLWLAGTVYYFHMMVDGIRDLVMWTANTV